MIGKMLISHTLYQIIKIFEIINHLIYLETWENHPKKFLKKQNQEI